jgi:hypothetical protein
MSVTTFTPDARFEATLESLKKHYGASSKAEVIRKAVALLSIVSEQEDKSGVVTLRHGEQDIKIIVR